MKVLLKPELERFVADKVKAGTYSNSSDVVNDALEVLREQEEFSPRHKAYLRRELRKGLAQLNRGRHSTLDAKKIIVEERRRMNAARGQR